MNSVLRGVCLRVCACLFVCFLVCLFVCLFACLSLCICVCVNMGLLMLITLTLMADDTGHGHVGRKGRLRFFQDTPPTYKTVFRRTTEPYIRRTVEPPSLMYMPACSARSRFCTSLHSKTRNTYGLKIEALSNTVRFIVILKYGNHK